MQIVKTAQLHLSRHYKVTRRGIQIALGLLWLLDGVLQLQPGMFTASFASNVIAPAAEGQPAFVSAPMHFVITIFLLQPALFNALAALTQLGLGLLILWKRTSNLGLWCSVGWGLFVWYIGEGLGGLAGGHALLLMGAPGAALIYVLLALGVRTPKKPRSPGGLRPAYWLLVAWAGLWTLGSIYQLLPGQNTVTNAIAMIQANTASAPVWLTNVDNDAAQSLAHLARTNLPITMTAMQMGDLGSPTQIQMTPPQAAAGRWFLWLVVAVQVAIGLAVFKPGLIRWLAVLAGCLLGSVYWVVGQSMGSWYSGMATDPGTGPLFVLLGIAVLGCASEGLQVCRYFTFAQAQITTKLR